MMVTPVSRDRRENGTGGRLVFERDLIRARMNLNEVPHFSGSAVCLTSTADFSK